MASWDGYIVIWLIDNPTVAKQFLSISWITSNSNMMFKPKPIEDMKERKAEAQGAADVLPPG